MATLPDDQNVMILEITKVDIRTEKLLAVADTFVSGLFFSLTRGGLKLLQSAYRHLNSEQREAANTLLPGASTQKDLARLTGIRESSLTKAGGNMRSDKSDCEATQDE